MRRMVVMRVMAGLMRVVMITLVIMVMMVMAVVIVMSMVVIVVTMTVVMVIMAVIVMVVIVVGRRRRGALRLERSLDFGEPRTKATQPFLDHRIAAQPESAVEYLRRHVPITERPGQPRQRSGIIHAHLDQRLGLDDDLN